MKQDRIQIQAKIPNNDLTKQEAIKRLKGFVLIGSNEDMEGE